MNRLLVTLTLLTLCCAPAGAGTVHRWVDADGVTHFSDSPPAEAGVEVETIEVGDDYAPASGDEDYYSISNQWQRLREERLAREQLDLERARLRAERTPAPQPERDESYDRPPRYIAYPYIPHRSDRVGPRGRDRKGFRFDRRRDFDRAGHGFDRRKFRHDDRRRGGRRGPPRGRFSLGFDSDP